MPPETRAEAGLSVQVWLLHSSCGDGDFLAASERSCRLNNADVSDTFVALPSLHMYVCNETTYVGSGALYTFFLCS
jgi:hypothetical protein